MTGVSTSSLSSMAVARATPIAVRTELTGEWTGHLSTAGSPSPGQVTQTTEAKDTTQDATNVFDTDNKIELVTLWWSQSPVDSVLQLSPQVGSVGQS